MFRRRLLSTIATVALVTGVLGAGPVLAQPTTKADCKKGGWVQFGFRNQGQCIRFVNTGKGGVTTTTTAPTTTTTAPTTSTTTTTMASPSGAFLEDAANALD